MARKLIRSRDVFLEDHKVSDKRKMMSLNHLRETPIIPLLVSPSAIHDDHRGAGEDNNDGSAKPVEQASLNPLESQVESELKRFTRD